MLVIYGTDLSAPSNKVRFVANYLGLEFDYRRVNLAKGENRTEEFRKLHPAGKVPVIFEDGAALFESGAICKYLADRENSELYPKDLRTRALVDQWCDFATQHIGGAMGKLFFNRVLAKWRNAKVDEQSIEDGVEFLGRFLPVIEDQLSRNSYLIGDQLTLADLTLLAVLDPAEVVNVDLAPFPRITAWRNKLQQESFYTKTHDSFTAVVEQMRRLVA